MQSKATCPFLTPSTVFPFDLPKHLSMIQNDQPQLILHNFKCKDEYTYTLNEIVAQQVPQARTQKRETLNQSPWRRSHV